MAKFFFASLFVLSGCVCMAQDRIHTKDGRVIECRVSDSSNRDGKVFFFPADDPETSHFIPVGRIAYLELGNEHIVSTPHNYLKPAKERYSLQAPALPHMVGLTYDFLSNTYVHTHGATFSYGCFFDGKNGLYTEFAFRGLQRFSSDYIVDIFALIPHYERRFYMQRVGSFFFVRGGLGVNIYRAAIRWDEGTEHEGLVAPVLSLSLGVDLRLARHLYFEIVARYIGDFASRNFGYDTEPSLSHEGFLGGFSAGFRFGWGR